jgi:predicted porin
MKYFYLAAGLATFCLGAHAQSNVTLYGVVDLGITYTNSAQTGKAGTNPIGASQVALTDAHSTGLSGSRWGLRGSEDLGGGMKAIFVLENGFNANTGTLAQGGAEFGRQSYVGISSVDVGTVTLGRQYDPYIDFVQPLSASGTFAGYMGSHPNDLDNLTNTNRINNSIKFTTLKYGGFSAGGLYSLGGVTGSPTQNQIWALGAGYSGAGLSVGAGYLNARDPNVSFYGNTPNKGRNGEQPRIVRVRDQSRIQSRFRRIRVGEDDANRRRRGQLHTGAYYVRPARDQHPVRRSRHNGRTESARLLGRRELHECGGEREIATDTGLAAGRRV